MRAIPLLALAALLSACAHGGEKLDRIAITSEAERDPWEKTNRRIDRFNSRVDRAIVLPATDVYQFVVPAAARRGVAGFFNYAGEPTNFANAMAQGKIKRGFRALDRLLVNGILGLGITDPATGLGLEEQRHDFGQTLAVWGVPSGPYLVLPFFGPSTARDGAGFFVDFFLDPVDYADNRLFSTTERIAKIGMRVIDIRAGLRDQGEQLLQGAADPYATTRSAWLQLRRYQLFDGMPPPEPDEYEDWEDLPPSDAGSGGEAASPADGPATAAAPDGDDASEAMEGGQE
ncbi:MlaA family lipoprotein [Sandaracinobacteroides sp. A072]|uniref:MlaA family lipoprotein n=1 Tax=Sandaracinobacteroides sp. A072 TaxID=3461146 RepID=UPI004043088C